MNMYFIDALQGIGGLEEDEEAHKPTILEELREVLDGTESKTKHLKAYHLHVQSFDHPFSNAYWQVIASLDDNSRKNFYAMVLKGRIE